jgi:hypothetical protein
LVQHSGNGFNGNQTRFLPPSMPPHAISHDKKAANWVNMVSILIGGSQETRIGLA